MTTSELSDVRTSLVAHDLYTELRTVDQLRIFMRYHVFAVWDFFSLLKRLQAEVTTTSVPWLPAGHAEHGRFIMEIVLAEETDEDIDGGYISHFELYHRAMTELGADTTLIDTFLDTLGAGVSPVQALNNPAIPGFVRDFVGHTMDVALHGEPHQVAASFCHGRENLLPDVFTALREHIVEILEVAPVFKHYLDRHITLDHDEHGPLALRLLAALCDGDAVKEAAAARTGSDAIRARLGLWDGILTELRVMDPTSVLR